MTPEVEAALRAELSLDEGERRFVYDDKTSKAIVAGSQVIGNPSIAIGRNLAARGLSPAEIDFLFTNDREQLESDMLAALPWVTALSTARQVVMYSMYFNTSLGNIQHFVNSWPHFLAQMQAGQYDEAANNLETSEPWATEVGPRSRWLGEMVRQG